MEEKPVIIEDVENAIYGIFRGEKNSKKVAIFIPALTGTRIGPQRMFVEISNVLIKKGIATFCVDIPPAGDSYHKGNVEQSGVIGHYYIYLEKIIKFLRSEFSCQEIILISISLGCMPILEFAERNHLKEVILLSPNHLAKNTNLINKRNLQVYFMKIFKSETWYKLIKMNLNFRKIFTNLIHIPGHSKSTIRGSISAKDKIAKGKVHVLCVFGEKDPGLDDNIKFWTGLVNTDRFISFNQIIIKGSDHSFMGWSFKKDLSSTINEWINLN
jgi:hypothetical protein